MSIKRPLFRFAVDKIEALFKKNKKNKILIKEIRGELENRNTPRSRNLIEEIDSTQDEILPNEANDKVAQQNLDELGAEYNQKNQLNTLDESENLEDILKSITLKDFVKDVFVPVRVKNSILAENGDNIVGFDSIYSFITASKNDKKRLKRLEFFGEKSLNDLIFCINDYIERLDKGVLSVSNIKLAQSLVSNQDIPVDESVVDSLTTEQSAALKNIPLGFFVSSCNEVTVRTRNAILKGEGIYVYQNLYDFWVAPYKHKKSLLDLNDFGKTSLSNLIESVKMTIDKGEALAHFSNIFSKTTNINAFKSIDDFISYSLFGTLDDRERMIVHHRYIDDKVLTLQELGVKLDVTRERVRQIEERAISKLQGFILSFSKEESYQKFENELNNYFFDVRSYISIDSAIRSINKGSRLIGLYVKIFSKTLELFLDERFFHSKKFNGWFVNGEIRLTNEKKELKSKVERILKLNVAAQKSVWPITLESLSELMHLPECVTKDKVFLSNKFYIEETPIGVFVRFQGRITVKEAVRYVLRRYKRKMHFSEVYASCMEMFDIKTSERLVANALGDLTDGLIVERGTYNLYENMDISEHQINLVKKFCKTYLLNKQRYISAAVLFVKLKDERGIYDNYGVIDNEYILFGICQDDKSFVTRIGLMVGLNDIKFKGEYTSQVEEIVDFMEKEQRPLKLREIVDGLSDTRLIMLASLQNVLDSNKHNIFGKTASSYYLKDDRSHMIVDDEDLFEIDLNEL